MWFLLTGLAASDAHAASWQWLGPDALANRRAFAQVQLLDGRVLVTGGDVGGGTATAAAQLYDGATHRFVATTPMSTARVGHNLVLLADGRVLALGGTDATGASLASAEVYDPSDQTWTLTGSLQDARWDAVSVRLQDGRVLVVSGRTTNPSAECELYDPSTGLFTQAGGPARGFGHAALLLGDGRVMVTGGFFMPDILFYSVANGFQTLAELGVAAIPNYNFYGHTMTLLGDGTVLLVGGASRAGTSFSQTFTARYDATTHALTRLDGLLHARDSHAALSLPDGRVLVVGGHQSLVTTLDLTVLQSTEIFDPGTNLFTEGPALNEQRMGHAAVNLANDEVVVFGGRNVGQTARWEVLRVGCGTNNGGCDPASTCTESGSTLQCGPCPMDTFSEDGTGTTRCEPCALGLQAAPGSTACVPVGALDGGLGDGGPDDGGAERDATAPLDQTIVGDQFLLGDGGGSDAGAPPSRGGGCGCVVVSDQRLAPRDASLVLASLLLVGLHRRARLRGASR